MERPGAEWGEGPRSRFPRAASKWRLCWQVGARLAWRAHIRERGSLGTTVRGSLLLPQTRQGRGAELQSMACAPAWEATASPVPKGGFRGHHTLRVGHGPC